VALSEADSRTRDLRKRAAKLKGDARERLNERVQELEKRQKELRGRLEEIGAEARRVVESARS
jgi:hypothetical protein